MNIIQNIIKKVTTKIPSKNKVQCKTINIILHLLVGVFVLVVIINHFKLSKILRDHQQKVTILTKLAEPELDIKSKQIKSKQIKPKKDIQKKVNECKMDKLKLNSSICHTSKVDSCPLGSYKQCTNNVMPTKKQCDCNNQRAALLCKDNQIISQNCMQN